ncbi:MAG: hypothetical protein U0T74_13535 [Chitinophagales bacterium]
MTEQTFNLKGGVLIIGSLLWQDNAKPGNDTIRRDWRNNHLDMVSSIGVKVPMRYGRLSSGDIYTMTFANSCRGKNLGTAFAVPFRNNPITNLTQLMKEARSWQLLKEWAEYLFLRERQPWCVLGILFNKKKIARSDRAAFSNWWQQQLSEDTDYIRFHHNNFKHGSEKPLYSSKWTFKYSLD